MPVFVITCTVLVSAVTLDAMTWHSMIINYGNMYIKEVYGVLTYMYTVHP